MMMMVMVMMMMKLFLMLRFRFSAFRGPPGEMFEKWQQRGPPQMPGTFEFLSPELNMPLPFSSLIWWETATKFGLPAWTWRKHSTDLSFCLVCCVGKATCATSAWQIFNLNKRAPYSQTEFITIYCVVWNNDMCWTHCVLMLGWNLLCRNGHHVWQPQAHG